MNVSLVLLKMKWCYKEVTLAVLILQYLLAIFLKENKTVFCKETNALWGLYRSDALRLFAELHNQSPNKIHKAWKDIH